MGLEDDPTRGKDLVWIPCTSLNKDRLISHWSKLHPSPVVFFRTLETRCPNPCITSFIELDDGKIYRKTLYFMVKTMVSCKFSLQPIQWQLGSHRDLIPTTVPHLWSSSHRPDRRLVTFDAQRQDCQGLTLAATILADEKSPANIGGQVFLV